MLRLNLASGLFPYEGHAKLILIHVYAFRLLICVCHCNDLAQPGTLRGWRESVSSPSGHNLDAAGDLLCVSPARYPLPLAEVILCWGTSCPLLCLVSMTEKIKVLPSTATTTGDEGGLLWTVCVPPNSYVGTLPAL